MKLARISIANIRHKSLSSFLSILLLAFGTGIIVLLLSASEQIEKQFTRNIRDIDMVVGAKGSPLQLILSSVYHIDDPTGNIKLSEFRQLSKNPMVETAIPLAYGDNYEGYRIVGTEPSYPAHYGAQLASGKWWKKSGDAVIGARVAELKELTIGNEFHGSHGVSNSLEHHHEFEYRVTGILEPTGTVLDKLILTDIESVWDVHAGHEETDSNHTPREITAGLVMFKNPMGNLMVPRMVNQNTGMQAALPAIEINRLFSLMGTGVKTLQWLAILIVLISAISVFISLYQSLKERKYELALMRSLGAGSGQLFYIVLLEGIIISFVGYLAGLILGKLALYLMAQIAQEAYQYSLSFSIITMNELILLPIVLGIGFVAALIPALQAYRLNISKVLANA